MNAVVVLSGGAGVRMRSDVPKQYLEAMGKPVLVHAAEPFQRCDSIDHIIVVAAREWEAHILAWKEAWGLSKLRAVAPAGAHRQLSILSGLLAAKPFLTGSRDGVVIQDAVRPFTSLALIDALLAALDEAPAVMPSLPVTDTVYTSRDGQWVDGLLDRSAVYAGQAPEAFRFCEYLRLYEQTPPEELCAMSGSCQLPFLSGWRVKMIPGDRDNIKITYPSDLSLLEAAPESEGR